jgi:hypothetical protein
MMLLLSILDVDLAGAKDERERRARVDEEIQLAQSKMSSRCKVNAAWFDDVPTIDDPELVELCKASITVLPDDRISSNEFAARLAERWLRRTRDDVFTASPFALTAAIETLQCARRELDPITPEWVPRRLDYLERVRTLREKYAS